MIELKWYIFLIGFGVMLIALAFGDKKGWIRINNSMLYITLGIVMIYLFIRYLFWNTLYMFS